MSSKSTFTIMVMLFEIVQWIWCLELVMTQKGNEYVKNPCLVFVSLLHVYTNIYCTRNEFCQASLLIFLHVRVTRVNFFSFIYLLQDGRIDYNEFVAMMQKGNFVGPGKKGLQSSFSIAFR